MKLTFYFTMKVLKSTQKCGKLFIFFSVVLTRRIVNIVSINVGITEFLSTAVML